MNSLLIHPLSFLLAILWYEPTQDGEQRVLPFALVTTIDLLALFIFLFKKQIGHWHDILILDIEQGHLKAGDIDDASATLVDRSNAQVEHHNFSARPETPQNEMAMRGPSNVRLCTGMVHPGSEDQEMEEGQADLELGQQEQRGGFFINLGMDIGDDSGFKNIHPSAPVGTPATIYSNIHPALRPTFDDTSQPVSPDGFQTPKQAPSPTETNVLELNQI